jgi:hypothetical protein
VPGAEALQCLGIELPEAWNIIRACEAEAAVYLARVSIEGERLQK